MKKQENTILLPYSTDLSLGEINRPDVTEKYVAIGQKSLGGTDLFDVGAMYNGNPQDYRVEVRTEVETENCDLQIDGKPTPALEKYLSSSVI
jgi:hypothetical protein